MNNNNIAVELGIVEKCEPWLLTNRYIPNKVGGKPAWLNLENIPSANDMICPKCNKAFIFLCQVYAPLDDPSSYHRTIFLFVCKTAACYTDNFAKNLIVFRNQLPLENKFYSCEPPCISVEMPELKYPINICELCGCRGPYQCGKCKLVNYCCKEHQRYDWKYNHKQKCGNSTKEIELVDIKKPQMLFDEYELLLMKDDDDYDDDDDEDDKADKAVDGNQIEKDKSEKTNESAEDKLEETAVGGSGDTTGDYEKYLKSDNAKLFKDMPESELSQYFDANVEDKIFQKFKKTIQFNNEQVLRYSRNGEPLWISSECILNKEQIPNCEYCGSQRIFEFQIMPQMLIYIEKNTLLDWGILNVYTCKDNCDASDSYRREFVYMQKV